MADDSPYLEIEAKSREDFVRIAELLGYTEAVLTGENTVKVNARHGIDLMALDRTGFGDGQSWAPTRSRSGDSFVEQHRSRRQAQPVRLAGRLANHRLRALDRAGVVVGSRPGELGR
ncbi:hypothetical protein [Nocardia panacis]|uniref:hypothetical protein n=1 Tax=Nocardia panacis TaxID=2340916 RepID=UPI00193940B1|nr:hypothetical protein [Nocardia panacis]